MDGLVLLISSNDVVDGRVERNDLFGSNRHSDTAISGGISASNRGTPSGNRQGELNGPSLRKKRERLGHPPFDGYLFWNNVSVNPCN